MRSSLPAAIALVCAAGISTTAIGSPQDGSAGKKTAFPLEGRHEISFCAGLIGGLTAAVDVTGATVSTEAHTNAPMFSLSYAYWFEREWNIGLGLSIIDAETSNTAAPAEVYSQNAFVTPVLFGVAYYPEKLAITPSLRPYASLAAGPYVGSATNNYVGATYSSESVTETALGMRVRAGVDWFFGGRFAVGVVFGYHLVDDFDRQIGTDTNYSGPEFMVGIGILLGKGR